jgi:hypothetical protein
VCVYVFITAVSLLPNFTPTEHYPPPANSFVIGTAVINTHTHTRRGGAGARGARGHLVAPHLSFVSRLRVPCSLLQKRTAIRDALSIRFEIMGCGATKAAVNASEPRKLEAAEETRVNPAAITTGQAQDGPSVVCTASGPPRNSVLRAHTTCLCCDSTRAALVSRAVGNIDSTRFAPGAVDVTHCTYVYIYIRIHIHKHT